MTDKSAPNEGEFLFYATEDGVTRVTLLVDGETVWMSKRLIADLFETTTQNVSQHVASIYSDGELGELGTCKDFLQVQEEGGREIQRSVGHYNLDMILAIGYRVRSKRGVQFRRWATETLSEYLTKGFVMNDERLKAGTKMFGKDYFDELLERIRDIRASERRFYQKITDIYATASDYSGDATITQEFFATVQNKLEWAITGKTAAELIKARADAGKPNMGLATWKNSPSGKIRKADVTVAKNYLDKDEVSELNRIVVMYLDYAEDQASKHKAMTMAGWASKLEAFLVFNDRNILKHAGKVKKSVADRLAKLEYEKFDQERKRLAAEQPTSDFDNFVEGIKRLNPPDD